VTKIKKVLPGRAAVATTAPTAPTPHRDRTPARDDDRGAVAGDAAYGPSSIRILNWKEVRDRVRLSFPTVWRMMRAGTFPRSRQIGDKRMGWLEHEVSAWLLSLPVRTLLGDEGHEVTKGRKRRAAA
jgi:prophage regulatory protein